MVLGRRLERILRKLVHVMNRQPSTAESKSHGRQIYTFMEMKPGMNDKKMARKPASLPRTKEAAPEPRPTTNVFQTQLPDPRPCAVGPIL